MNKYNRAKEIFKKVYSETLYKSEFVPLIEEGVEIVNTLGLNDVRLAFRLGTLLRERIHTWGAEIEIGIQKGELTNAFTSHLEVLANLSLSLGSKLEEIYKDNGGKEIEEGRELMQKHINHLGLFLLEGESEIIMGMNLMLLGLLQFSEVDLFGAQSNALNLKFFIESEAEKHASEVIKGVWKETVSKINKLLNLSMIGFYPDLTN